MYEDDRIRRKNTRFVNARAYIMIQELELKGLNDSEMAKFLETLLVDVSNTETQGDVVRFASKVIKKRQELSDEKITIINCNDILCPVVRISKRA